MYKDDIHRRSFATTIPTTRNFALFQKGQDKARSMIPLRKKSHQTGIQHKFESALKSLPV
jgi:hypothetical protein